MEYVSVDPVEAPVVVFDAKKGSGLKPEKTDKGVVPARLVQAAPLDRPGRAAARARAARPRRRWPTRFAGQREKFGRMHAAPLSHDFATAAAECAVGAARVGRDGGRQGRPRLRARPSGPSLRGAHPPPSERVARNGAAQVPLARRALAPARSDATARPVAARAFMLTAVDVDLRGLRRQRRASHRSSRRSCRSGAALGPALRPRPRSVRAGGSEPRHAHGAGEQGDRRGGPRARLRPPQRRDHRPARRAGAPRPAGQAPTSRSTGDFLVRPRRRQLLGAGRLPWFPQPYAGGSPTRSTRWSA